LQIRPEWAIDYDPGRWGNPARSINLQFRIPTKQETPMTTTLDPFRKRETLEIEVRLASSKPFPRGIRCRQITPDDIDTIIDLLCEGFTRMPRHHWVTVLEIMSARRVTPDRAPRYGYMIESDGRAVGLLLVIETDLRRDGATTRRSNGSSWYVRHNFRSCANVLLAQWLRSHADTYLNVFPAKHTFPIIEALGFVRFTNGIFLSIPAIILRGGGIRILNAGCLAEAEHRIPDEHYDLLVDHSRAGCIALWCETRDGGYPFVFRRRVIKSCLPCAQLIYCRDLEDLSHLAGPIGRYLLRRGLPMMLTASNGPIRGLPGVYIDGKYPMYFRGGIQPRLNDLAYTEAGLFGF
jgi:hypothetical protein